MTERSSCFCVSCGGRTAPIFRPHTVDRDGKLVVIRDVPMHECDGCGETYMTPAVMRQLDALVAKLLTGRADETIVHYQAA
ncbi:type II toxin-antitoxin system MqsA family antitoxin [Nocardioides sp. AE5]|uniref:type II toxin-antitoxin system MqsA family antitoxin n=1 Tax=Nocardioides sp. AE5 TaxID=2962573 RepID=UPI002880FAAE|nr:type II toxin-antitoxin system MqsA family antitoxin [Nocardioides sp. AE5]MDT0203024.1 type II toxin-antitoxin system MqsA family antitoxin [Nocardioides sp. AE5]